MSNRVSPKVIEAWTGPGRADSVISTLVPSDNALRSEVGQRGVYEWWYFDAVFNNGYKVVVFFYASNPNPGAAGRPGIELVLLRPDGVKTQRSVAYPRSEFRASRERPDVQVGKNYLRADYSSDLPVYVIHLEEGDLEFHLTYHALVNGWRPGSGYSRFGSMGTFAWIVPVPRARVTGTIRDRDQTIQVEGVGYHDHNWLDFQFQRIIEYWMWGRVYSEHFTVAYALIQCNARVDRHEVRVLMVAQDQNVILSTGEFEILTGEFDYDARAGHWYPIEMTFNIPGRFKMLLRVREILEAENMLDRLGAMTRFLAGHILRIRPGYFRLLSDFTIEYVQSGHTQTERGTTLHEIVAFKPIRKSP